MNEEKFNKYLEERISLIREVLESKAKEYSKSTNRYINFEDAARISEESPIKKIDDFMLKHYVSYRQLLKELNKFYNGEILDLNISKKYVKEKFGDIINYFILSEAYILEKFCKDE